ncbi:RNase H domain-containing protein [Trichonephila clavipes]|nr:RNase H domain-containing protein [Trichonephila clavipes]
MKKEVCSRNAIKHMSNWQSVSDGVSILIKLRRLSTARQIHLPWIPCHEDLEGNEIADSLAKADACRVVSIPFFWRMSQKLNTRIRSLGLFPPRTPLVSVLSSWRLSGSRNRQEQTILARFRSGHFKAMKVSERPKSFEMCTNCFELASPAHIL